MARNTRWIYAKNGHQFGAGLRELLVAASLAGTVDASTLIWDTKTLSWVEARMSEFQCYLING